ncbi:MAG: hypothetical protein AAFQ01_01455, partial [Bacteroidota bacterium]
HSLAVVAYGESIVLNSCLLRNIFVEKLLPFLRGSLSSIASMEGTGSQQSTNSHLMLFRTAKHRYLWSVSPDKKEAPNTISYTPHN